MKLSEVAPFGYGGRREIEDKTEKFTYNGKQIEYSISDAGDDEVNKIWHEISIDGGKGFNPGWSPYSHFSQADIKLWIDAGMPDRQEVGKVIHSNGPVKPDDFKKYIELTSK